MAVFDVDYDVGDALAADQNGTALKELQDALQEGIVAVKKDMDSGLAPEEFKKAEALQSSFDSAKAAVEKIWTEMHQK